jgi:hypothetical protein
MLALPMSTAPAALSLRTTSASSVATREAKYFDPMVVGSPAVSMLSL